MVLCSYHTTANYAMQYTMCCMGLVCLAVALQNCLHPPPGRGVQVHTHMGVAVGLQVFFAFREGKAACNKHIDAWDWQLPCRM